MMRVLTLTTVLCAMVGLAGCTTVESSTTASVTSDVTMEVTDIDYGSVRTDRRYLVSYSFPDDRGRFAVRSASIEGISEPVADTSDYAFVNDDVASSVICQGQLRKLSANPDYLVADRAYQSAYVCTNSEG